MTIADYTCPELIALQLNGRDPAAVIGELSLRLESQGRLEEALAFSKRVLHRESLYCTAMEPGWALPHARMEGTSRVSFAFGRSATGLAWGGHLVRCVFLCVVPENDAANYLKLLAAFARLSGDSARCQRLLNAPDADAIFDTLGEIRLPKPTPVAATT